MFGWIKKVLPGSKNNTPTDRPDAYRPRERQLYSYWDGKVMRESDPMVLYRKVMDVRAKLSADITTAFTESKFASASYKDAISTIKSVFEVETMENGGLTEGEVYGLLDHFMAWAEGLKKNTDPTQTSLGTTLPSTPPTSAGGPPTPSISPSGSTEAGNKTDESTPSPKVPV